MNVRWANSKCSLSNLSFVLPFSLCLEVVSKLQHRIFRLALGTFLNFLSRHFFVNTFLSHTMPMTKACNTNELHGPVLLFTIQHGTVQSSYAALALFFLLHWIFIRGRSLLFCWWYVTCFTCYWKCVCLCVAYRFCKWASAASVSEPHTNCNANQKICL